MSLEKDVPSGIGFFLYDVEITQEDAERICGPKFERLRDAAVRIYREDGNPISCFLVEKGLITFAIPLPDPPAAQPE